MGSLAARHQLAWHLRADLARAGGQPTNLEMCYLFTTAYPKGALQGLDAWGTIAHGTSSCLGP